MLRHCSFFCNFHTHVMLRWGGVGWDVNVHWHFHTHTHDATPLLVLLQLPHTHTRDATLGWGGVGCYNVHWHFHTHVMLRWGCLYWLRIRSQTISPPQKAPWKWIAKYFDMSDRSNGAGKTYASCWRQLRRTSSNCLDSTSSLLKKKTAEDVSMEKLNPQVRRPLFLHQNCRFAMAKPWICANYADGKNSAGKFKTSTFLVHSGSG